QERKSLTQKANIALISTWMKNLGTGKEKFRLILIRRISEDPMEVRVAAARLMQQKSESPPTEESKGSCGIYVGRV
ncbi:hypothetical protein Dimus_009586, partial [Dionaea muscipula]